MSDKSRAAAPWSFWLIGALCLAWNLLGVMAYIQEMNPDALASMEQVMRNMIEKRPAWATAAFAIAVWGGALGCLLLLLRKSISRYVFIASLLGVVVQMTYNLVIAKSASSYGPFEFAMIILIPAIAVFLIWYTNYAARRNWIS